MEEMISADAKLIAQAKIRQARAMPPEAKFRAGSDLFEEACLWSLAGIAAQYPELDEAGRIAELRRRLALAGR